jgi:hypothetical protein
MRARQAGGLANSTPAWRLASRAQKFSYIEV